MIESVNSTNPKDHDTRSRSDQVIGINHLEKVVSFPGTNLSGGITIPILLVRHEARSGASSRLKLVMVHSL